MHLSEEEFHSLKILPITVLTNGQKLALDINVKSISKNLIKEKYSINSQYFILVDQNSHAKKMRVGAKIYTFRGHVGLGNFVDNLRSNIGQDVFSELQIPN
jgi:hypothetical protein